MKSLSDTIASDVKGAEAELKEKLTVLKKVQQLLKRATSRIAKNPWPFSDTRALLSDLTKYDHSGSNDVIHRLQTQLKQRLDDAAKSYECSFFDALTTAARESNLATGNTNGTYVLGPFSLLLDFAKETAEFQYADQIVTQAMTLNADGLVRKASELVKDLLNTPTDVSKLASEFDESIRVALVRGRKAIQGRELRCPLPELHREMTLLRQDRNRAVSSRTFRDYPLARFVVELKTLIQSEENVNSSQRFRLEPAVIENTKNPKKSVFIPKDIHKGFGEGTYFQAIVLVSETP